jgi:hypothetical protein
MQDLTLTIQWYTDWKGPSISFLAASVQMKVVASEELEATEGGVGTFYPIR